MAPHDTSHIATAGTPAAVAGWLLSGYNWFTDGMSPLAIVCTLMTMVWTGIQIHKHFTRKRKPGTPAGFPETR